MWMIAVYTVLALGMMLLRRRDGLDALGAVGLGLIWPLALAKEGIDAAMEGLLSDRFSAGAPASRSTS